MKKYIIIGILFFGFESTVEAQNTVFNNVGIGTDGPAFGVKIKANFPGSSGGYARSFNIANETGATNFIALGVYGQLINGVASATRSYIGRDWNDTFMNFLANGNVGIGTTNPVNKLDVNGEIAIGSQSVNANTTKIFLRNPLGKTWAISSGANMITESSFSIYNWSDNQSIPFFHINISGNVGLGTISPDERLTVKGKIHTQEVKVDMLGPLVPDYVFTKDYKLKTLLEVETYINNNNHLPEIPSANEIEKNGLFLAEMNMSLLKKVEELTLYAIEQEKKLNKQSALIDSLKKENESFKNLSERLLKIEAQINKN
jgi:hypothetical protein